MSALLPGLLGLIGLALGPFLHGLAVQAGADGDLHSGLTCPRCGEDGAVAAIRCSCYRWRWREGALALLVALAFAGMARAVGWRPLLIAHLAMVVVTSILIVTDLDHFRIPNRILYPGTVAAFVLLIVGAALEDEEGSLLRGVAGSAIYFGLLLAVFLVARGDGFGFGDVKLAALLGLFTAYHSYRTLAWGLIITAVLGAIPAFVLLAMGRGRKAAIPYGPPLILGAWGAIVFSGALVG
jgi:leader peptidase (prepilin peptidase)/N-methyltransferase